MQPPKPLLAWLNCYGAWDPNLRRPIETIGYDQYLDAFVHSLLPFKGRLAGITISGGMKDALGRTECETTKPELEKRLMNAGIPLNFEINTDVQSVTSMSIAREFSKMVAEKINEALPLLFVDAVRYESNVFTVEYFCKEFSCPVESVRQFIIPLPRLDDDPHSTPDFQQKKLALMKEKGIAEVERTEEESRRKS